MFSSRGETMRYGLLPIGLAALALGGCSSDVYKAADIGEPDFGRAVRQNIAAQVADPAPNYEYADPPASSGPRTSKAQERYETGTVIQPTVEATQNVTTGAGGGGGK